jgi:hypothetical protein
MIGGFMQTLLLVLQIVIAAFSPVSDSDAIALHRFSPEEITVEHARDHIWAARVAAAAYSVDENMILAIAYHESRMHENAVGPESGGRVSCGSMTPSPVAFCEKKPLLAQILEGTRHWAVEWREAPGVYGEHEALLGVAGGYRGIRACRLGPVLRYGDHGDDLCLTPEVFWRLRDRIRAARQAKS